MEFDNYNISTQTLIVSTNVNIDCMEFYSSINCINIKSPSKSKNRMLVDSEEKINDGDIVFAQYKTQYKGMNFKKQSGKYFLNSVTMIMKIENKYINIKVSNKGKLQITGCNQNRYAIMILNHFWIYIKDRKEIWFYKEKDMLSFKAIIVPVMCNINFSIGFQINRNLLHNIINNKTDYISILEPSDGYVGVNIKIPIKKEPLEDIFIDEYTYENDEWIVAKTKFMDYISTLSIKEQKKKITKSYINTFLVFYSGKVIFSGGISFINRKEAYLVFMDIINRYRDEIKN